MCDLLWENKMCAYKGDTMCVISREDKMRMLTREEKMFVLIREYKMCVFTREDYFWTLGNKMHLLTCVTRCKC